MWSAAASSDRPSPPRRGLGLATSVVTGSPRRPGRLRPSACRRTERPARCPWTSPAARRTDRCCETPPGGHAEPAGEVGRRPRLVQCREHGGAARPEKRRERRRPRRTARVPQRRDPAGGIDDRRLPGRVDDRDHARPDEHARHEEQAAVAEVERRLGALADAQLAAGPCDRRVHVGEQAAGAAVGQRARAVEHVALEERPDPRPGRGERDVPVGPHQVGEAGHGALGARHERLERGRHRPPAIGARDLGRDLLGRDGEHRGQLVLELDQRAGGRGAREVGRVDVAGHERPQRREVEAGHRPPGRGHPRQMDRPAAGVVQRVDAAHRLGQRRHREAHVRERLGAEAHDDHSRQTKSDRAIGRPGGPSGA